MSNWSRSIDAQSVLTTLIRAHNAVKKKSFNRQPSNGLSRHIILAMQKKNTKKETDSLSVDMIAISLYYYIFKLSPISIPV